MRKKKDSWNMQWNNSYALRREAFFYLNISKTHTIPSDCIAYIVILIAFSI